MWNTKFKKLRFESLEDRQLLSVGPLLNLSYFLSETENAAIVNSSYSSDSSVESADHFSSLLAGFQTGQTAELPGEPVLLLPPRQHGIIRPVQFVNTVENSAPVQFTTSSSNSGGADSSLNVSISQTGNASIFESHQCLDGNDCSCTLDEKYPLIRVNAEGAACSSSNGVVKIALSGTAVYGSDYSFVDNDSFIPFTVSNTGDFIEISLSGGYDSNSGGSDILAEFYVIPLNNGNPNDGDRTVQFTLEETETECSGGVFLPLYTIGNATAEVEIKDDDDWTITGSGGDSIWERAPYDDLPFGEFEITRSGGPDRTYGITTEFVLSGSATPMSDYHLSWFNANDYETVISIYQDNDDVWKGSVYFPANTTDDTITIYVIPNNDAIPENNETVTITVTNAYANPLYPFNASGSGTFTIKDDDKWKISVETTDDTATERISDVTQ
ncbi:MAG: hypothetical protein LBG58_12705, partial [Planctomycetaceae bacterium]|nr:hypothetical protein [Planctomycetaceae bacterium]